MNYLKIYCNLIRKAESRIAPEGYVERHHIFPKSIFGENSRIVVLTGREHYIAHLLLKKIYIKRYGIDNHNTKKMICALWYMSNCERHFNSFLYEDLRKQVALIYSGNNNPAKRDCVRKKISDFVYSLGDNHPMKSIENRKKQSKMMKNNNPSKRNDVKQKLKERMCGNTINLYRKPTEETIKKLREVRCKKTYELISPDGEIFVTKFLSDFKIKYNLDHSSLLKVAKGKLITHKGWKVKVI